MALRAMLARLFGWTVDREESIDHALQAIRSSTTRRTPLFVCSSSNPVAIAYQLHRRAFDVDRPFVRCDPRQKVSGESVRSLPNVMTAREALASARGGTVCVWASRLPSDVGLIREAMLDPDSRLQVVVCATKPTRAVSGALQLPPAIVIPSLARRTRELGLIVDEYADDAREELGASPYHFDRADRAWVVENASTSLAGIEAATMRLVALRKHDNNLSRAADALGVAQVSLSRWCRRNGVAVSRT